MVNVRLNEDEMELAILALEFFRRHHLGEYDEEDRRRIAKEAADLERKLRRA